MNFTKIIPFFVIVLSLVSCVYAPPHIDFSFKKDVSYSSQPHNIYIVSSTEGTLFVNGSLVNPDRDEEANFGAAIVESLKTCSVRAEFHKWDRLDFNGSQNEFVKKFSPDAVLAISLVSATKYGAIVDTVVLHAELTDVQEKKVVWKAEFTVPVRKNMATGLGLSSSMLQAMGSGGLVTCSPSQEQGVKP